MAANLDINTDRGRVAAALQHRAADIVFSRSESHCFIHTSDTDCAAVDGFIVAAGFIAGFAEIKSRDSTYNNFMTAFKGEWLLTHQKLLDIQAISKLLRLPGYGMIYLVPDEIVLVLQLTDKDGIITCKYRTAHTETQRTINGDVANRLNAFINVSSAKIYRQ